MSSKNRVGYGVVYKDGFEEGSSEFMDKMNIYPAEARKAAESNQEIIVLNVGGKRFSTSRQTLTWISDSFFSSLMSGRIASLKDDTGAIFIDRDPDSFGPILNFMRTRSVDLRNVDLKTLKLEAEFFGLLPLVKRLAVCEELERSSCGSLLFYCQIKPPVFEQQHCEEDIHAQENSWHRLFSLHPTVLVKNDYSRQVLQITGHGNCIAVAYNHCICVLGVRESRGWEVIFITPPLDRHPQRVCLNTRYVGGTAILAAVIGFEIKVWVCSSSSTNSDILASFDMKLQVDGLFFIGKQLVAISNTGKVVVWQSVQKHWQLQEVEAICSYDTAGFFLLLGCTNGSIYYIDMQKFPVRMKDNDLLVTQLFEDPLKEAITALSVYVTPNSCSGQNWMEVAYGTIAGTVRVMVRHPENIGQAPQIFQSYNVHTCPVMRVVLGERHLISVCAENHVRTWTVTRFRGRISTQPGSSPIASFKLLSLEGSHSLFYPENSIGPFGERDEEQVFVQRIIPDTDSIFVRSCSTGSRVCKIESVDGSNISAYYVYECEAINRTGLRSRRFIFTGHLNGTVQVWDLTAALDLSHKSSDDSEGGPSKYELLELLQHCDVGTAPSLASSTFSSRAPSPSPSLMSIMYPGIKPSSGRMSIPASPLCHTPVLLNNCGNGVNGAINSNTLSRSKKTLLPTSASGHNLTTIFQPVSTSHSVNETQTSKDAQPRNEIIAAKVSVAVKEEPKAAAESVQRETEKTNVLKPKLTRHKQREMADRHEIRSDLEGTVHLRSRSNEMDYVSFTGCGDSASSAFRSPPLSAQIFRPLSFNFHEPLCGSSGDCDNGEGLLRVQLSSIAQPADKVKSSPSLVQNEESTLKEEDNQTRLMSSANEFEEPIIGERSSWLKDFNESLWSNYIASSDQIF